MNKVVKKEQDLCLLCTDCRRACKQPATVTLIRCRRYYPYAAPFKAENLQQTSLFDPPPLAEKKKSRG